MLKSLEISNFRSLGEGICLRPRKLTALVGPNGSGKSNVVDALRFVSDAVQLGLTGAITHWNGIGSIRRWSSGHPYHVRFHLAFDVPGGAASYAFELAGDSGEEFRVSYEEAVVGTNRFRVEDGAWQQGPTDLRPPLDSRSLALQLVGGDERFEPLASMLRRIAVYSIFPDVLRQPQKYSPARPMERHGSNWVSLLKDDEASKWKDELVAALNRLTGDIEDIKVKAAATFLVPQFKHAAQGRRSKWFDASQESDGTLRVAGIITALLQQPPLTIMGIEEPELTVHPGAIALLFDYLKQASRESQVIVTTHSPELLDLMDADDVWVVHRTSGDSRVAPLDERQRQAVREGLLSPGQIMRTESLQPALPLPS